MPLPNGPVGHPTVHVFLAGGVPEVMLHLRELGLLDLTVLTVTGEPLEKSLAWWEKSDRRRVLREMLRERDGIDPDDVIMSPARAKSKGLTSTVCFPRGNLAPEGSVIKSTAIDPRASMPTASIARSVRPGSSTPSATPSRPSRGRPNTRSSPATCSCSAAVGRWARAWKRPIKSPRP